MRRLVLLVVLILVSACSRKLDHGEVIGKHYEPERTLVMVMPIRISCGRNCWTTMMIPYFVRDDEDWVLTVSGEDEDGNIISEDWYTSSSFYETVSVGDNVIYNTDKNSRDDPVEKLRKAN